ncbi:MAG: hypothetical protein MPK62_02030 [Alphaproteobacteria bacterium]|nr:hypothetical protein [Alphaproteobacteria bacterium]
MPAIEYEGWERLTPAFKKDLENALRARLDVDPSYMGMDRTPCIRLTLGHRAGKATESHVYDAGVETWDTDRELWIYQGDLAVPGWRRY